MFLCTLLLSCAPSEETSTQDLGAFVPVKTNEDIHAEQGYAITTWLLSPQHEEPYSSIFEGERPKFYLVHPADMQEGEELPVLLWLHGGTIGDDTAAEDGGEFPGACTLEHVEEFVWKAVTAPSYVPDFIAERRWVMVAPRNDWCDYYQGMGPEDEVDPERHYGYHHVREVLDFIHRGDAGFLPSGELYGWGTSAGAGAAASVAWRYGGFSALIFDSGLASTPFYWQLTEKGAFEHIFGGPPFDSEGNRSEVFDRYIESSPYLLIQERGLRVPMFIAWNQLDQLVPEVHAQMMEGVFEEFYTPADIRWGLHDYNHPSPGGVFHVQSPYGIPPWGYETLAYIDFLDGRPLEIWEAEDRCEGEVGQVESGTDPLRNFSGHSARVGVAGQAGELCLASLEGARGAGEPGTVTLAMTWEAPEGGLSPSAPVGTLTWTHGSEQLEVQLTAGDFASGSGLDEDLLHQYRSSSLELPTLEGSLSYVSQGSGLTRLDTILLSGEPQDSE